MAVFELWGEVDDPERIDDEIPAGIRRHGSWGHAQIWQRDNPMKHFWARRASSIGESLDPIFAIRNWELRAAGQAIARNLDLLQMMQAFPPLIQDPRPDETREQFEDRMRPIKREADGVIELALDRNGATRKANRGTALHRAWQTRMQGDPLPPQMDGSLVAGLEKMDDLMRGLDIHEIELFTAWEDLNPPQPEQRCRSCGTLDSVWSLRHGWQMVLPNGEFVVPGHRRCGDLKSGDNDIRKPGYSTQPVPYVYGDPFDWTVTAEQRRAGDGGWRPWAEAEQLQKDYALIIHVPLDPDHLQDSALWWVDLEKSMRFVRMAQTVRSIWNTVQVATGEHFCTATLEIDPAMADEVNAALSSDAAEETLAAAETLAQEIIADPTPAIVPAGDAGRAPVADLNDARIRHDLREADTPERVLAVFAEWQFKGWTAEHATLAEQTYDRLSATPLLPTPE
jgi:hypothetical protein